MLNQPHTRQFLRLFVFILIVGLPVALLPRLWSGASASVPTVSAAPLFIENVGQYAGEVRFHVADASATLWITDDALWVVLRQGEGASARVRGSRGGDARASETGHHDIHSALKRR